MNERHIDTDPQETQEWIESIEDALEEHGYERTRFLLETLIDYAQSKGARLPFNTSTPFVNTILPSQQPEYPGNREIERKIKYRFEMLETALEVARDGVGVIHCPKFIIELQNQKLLTKYQLVELPYPSPKQSSTDIYLITRKSYPENKIVKKLAKSLRVNCS